MKKEAQLVAKINKGSIWTRETKWTPGCLPCIKPTPRDQESVMLPCGHFMEVTQHSASVSLVPQFRSHSPPLSDAQSSLVG
ncbi:hypothetical protein E2C01_072329 [Portunus trituberculatus]|uniref:Uncharacterized protein n=1 Tax=Portunus trituberculatus TaxID=210409 RepID=A0A5B7HZK8_PORTR|nr:hypothetical protein [Portunus trituberculatus]